MKIEFDKSFLKSIDKLGEPIIKNRLIELIAELEKAESIKDIQQIKKLSGFKDFYRIRIGNYRLGLEFSESETLTLIYIGHRKDIYKFFP